MNIIAKDLKPGMTIPGLDNAYVFEVETGRGYLTYPASDGAMPDDTIIATFHDRHGEENYLLLNPEMPLSVTVDI